MTLHPSVPPVEPTGNGAPVHPTNKIPGVTVMATAEFISQPADDKEGETIVGKNAPMAVAIVVGSLVALFIGGILILIVSSLPAFKWRNRNSEVSLYFE